MSTLETAISDYLQHCKMEKRLSPKTLKFYEIDLLQLKSFLNEGRYSMKLSAITRVELRQFIASLSALKPKSVKRKIASVKAMFNYLEFEDSITVNPFRKMRFKIKEPQKLPAVLDIKEIMALFKTSYEAKNGISSEQGYVYFESIRNVVVLELLFSTGARVSEIANLRLESINLHTGSITIKGKGNKERIIQICNKETLGILRTYNSLFQDRIEKSGGWFLTNRLYHKLSDQ
jgi:integrase/recombinase XerD